MKNFEEYYNIDTLNLMPSPYDSRDYAFGDLGIVGATPIPKEYRTSTPIVFDQGQTSMCAACTIALIRTTKEYKQSGLTEPLSPAFAYADRNDGEDYEGMLIRDVAQKIKDDGICLEKDFDMFDTYDNIKSAFIAKKNELMLKAEPFKVTSYYTCRSREEVQTAIMECDAVQIGIPVFRNFYYPNDKGIIQYQKGQRSLGGHSVTLIGWTEIDDHFYWILQNSWGKDWGVNGCCYLPEEYPWQDDAYAYVDNYDEMKFEEYRKKFKD